MTLRSDKAGMAVLGFALIYQLIKPGRHTVKVIEATGSALSRSLNVAMTGNPNGICGCRYALTSPELAGCINERGHEGLHVQRNGFAYSEEDMAWAERQSELINDRGE